mmetsp:Transcript_146931/g.381854  ORF Transcript_146931/g.381854 Transcript_146931/m.381854 type:complete len:331 (-) Transcript_146931:120-1112(-)
MIGLPTLVSLQRPDEKPTASQEVVDRNDGAQVLGNCEHDGHPLRIYQALHRENQLAQLHEPHQAQKADRPRQANQLRGPRNTGAVSIAQVLESDCHPIDADQRQIQEHPRLHVAHQNKTSFHDDCAIRDEVPGAAGGHNVARPVQHCCPTEALAERSLGGLEDLQRDPDEVAQQEQDAECVPAHSPAALRVQRPRGLVAVQVVQGFVIEVNLRECLLHERVVRELLPNLVGLLQPCGPQVRRRAVVPLLAIEPGHAGHLDHHAQLRARCLPAALVEIQLAVEAGGDVRAHELRSAEELVVFAVVLVHDRKFQHVVRRQIGEHELVLPHRI